tara:strand:+ start:820 stop:1032 length:213 start_codon:yes stop_codon:yes gene_type:complete
MSKIKNYIMDIEEKVFGVDLEEIIQQAETVEDAETKVVKELGFTSSFDIDIVKDVVGTCWNEYWGDYVTY